MSDVNMDQGATNSGQAGGASSAGGGTPPTSGGGAGAGPGAGGPAMSEGKLYAILSYALNFIGIPFCIVPLVQKNNDFALYHGKQALTVWLAGLVLGVAGVIVFFVLAAIFVPLACIAQIAMGLGGLGMLILNVLGLVNALGDKMQPLPVLGPLAEKWFAGVKRAGV